MPRPSRTGPARPADKRKLTVLLVQRAKPATATYLVWDSMQRGLALRVQPSGYRAWKVVYRHGGRPRWLHLGAADSISLADARILAAEVMLRVARGGDPQAERKAQRAIGSTFEDLANRYRDEHAKKVNRSWRQADSLVRRNLLPFWGKLNAADVTRSEVKAMMARLSDSVGNQTLAAASAIFAWAIREEIAGIRINPCSGVSRNAAISRERVLADNEIANFWQAFNESGIYGAALKTLLLLGQRPGEVAHMRYEHINDGWWELPGQSDPQLGWPGTKSSVTHRIWLPQAVQDMIEIERRDGFVFSQRRRSGLAATMRAVCARLGVPRATPHDLRRTHGTKITALGLGREIMNRIQNHREGGIADVYDRHDYSAEIKRVMESVANHILELAENRKTSSNVVSFKS